MFGVRLRPIWSVSDLLVVTAGSTLLSSVYGPSREVWATAGTHFPEMSENPENQKNLEIPENPKNL